MTSLSSVLGLARSQSYKMLSLICQILRGKINGTDLGFTHSLCDYRGLRSYPKSTPRSVRMVEADRNKDVAQNKSAAIYIEGDCV